jgi:glycosyltransferase involved in cell wall biosynthesis
VGSGLGQDIGMSATHVAITPAKDEAENLPRLARSLAEQTAPLSAWIVVDNGSTDDTVAVVEALSREYPWIRLVHVKGENQSVRGRMSVRAFNAGYDLVEQPIDVVSNVDADVSLPPTYFEQLLGRFAADPRIGIAAGLCYEETDGSWLPVRVTAPFLRGALLTCRQACFEQIRPFEERVGWDSVACVLANANGWSTLLVDSLPYRHHRPTGGRDRSRWSGWRLEGETAYYMWYRPAYLIVRTLFRAVRDPAAAGLVDGYLRAALRHEPRHPDERFRTFVRSRQRLRDVPARWREVSGAVGRDPGPPATGVSGG